LDVDESDLGAELRQAITSLRARRASGPDVDVLLAAHAGILPPALQQAVSEYADGSPTSQMLVSGFDDVNVEISDQDRDRLWLRVQRTAQRGADRPRYSRAWKWWVPATAAIAASIVVFVWIGRRASGPLISSAPRSERTVATAQPAAPRLALLPLDHPAVRVGTSALAWRGTDARNAFVADLKSPLDAYKRGDFAAAAGQLSVLQGRYPRAPEVFFYQGISRLQLNDTAGAIAALLAAERIADPGFADDVAWYLAVAEQRAGSIDGAVTRLAALCGGAGPRAAAACAALHRQQPAPRD
jgi:hypothetical protein